MPKAEHLTPTNDESRAAFIERCMDAGNTRESCIADFNRDKQTMNYYNTKHCALKVKDVDDQGFKVQLYASAFDNVDSDGDIIVSGAFSKTIKERGPSGNGRIKHLLQHRVADVVGRPNQLTEDSTGLLVDSRIAKDTQGRDTIEKYKLDLFEHSIGFEVMDSEQKDEDGANIIKEIKLWEYSSVTWGANEQTPLVGMKSKFQTTEELVEHTNKRMKALQRGLHKGNFTDEAFEDLEIELKQLQYLYNTIISESLTMKGPSPDTRTLEPSKDGFNQFFN